MPLTALKNVVSTSQNGVGAFVLQCKRLEFHYCNWAGSSKGMNTFLTNQLANFAKANPQIEISVSPRPNKHPVVTGYYANGRAKPICVRNLDANQVLNKVELLKASSGEKNKKIVRKPVLSVNESVRGIWSPFHAERVHKI